MAWPASLCDVPHTHLVTGKLRMSPAGVPGSAVVHAGVVRKRFHIARASGRGRREGDAIDMPCVIDRARNIAPWASRIRALGRRHAFDQPSVFPMMSTFSGTDVGFDLINR